MAVRAGRAEPKGQQGRQAGRAGQAAASNLLEWFSQGLGASRETALSVNQSKGGAPVGPAHACQHCPKGRSVTLLLPGASSSAQTHQQTPSGQTLLICPL